MNYDRRSVLIGTGTAAAMTLAGCVGGSDSPEPVAVDVSHPEPRVVDVDNEQNDDGTYEFSVEIDNTGSSGDVGYTLVWLEDQDDDPYGSAAEVETSHERYFDGDERRTVSVTADPSDDRSAYGFRVWAGQVSVEVENEGGDGTVAVRLLDGTEIVDEAELLVDGGETTTHEFTSDFSDVDPEAIDVDVEAVD
ncbi:hypothetical protein [Halovivax cerinus]|uniref:CARDB domain-containing protein n=1 Tax=Halovivax cerinus TaxID=1487865 RepID=A0ABD5NTF9_9EURY|nr:hypothetical protein [Halovivax cerinus]